MPSHSEILAYGRRLHNALRAAVEDPDHFESGRVLREDFEHYACGMYLAGTLAFLEGKYGTKPWEGVGSVPNLDTFLLGSAGRAHPLLGQVSEAGLQALMCIRNSIIHNDGDLSKNKDRQAFDKVVAARIPGVSLSGPVVQLTSNNTVDFMEYVRKSFLAVSMQHGDL